MTDRKATVDRLVRALLSVSLALVLTGGPLPAAAAAEPSPDVLEVDYQNPLTAVPPLPRPATPSCTLRLMKHDFASSFGKPFVGSYTPPADCPAPWSMVVLDWNASVAGRQFDRLIGVWIGGVEVLRSTTPEPSPAGIKWHVEKEVSQYAPILTQPQTVVVDLGNVVNDTYTGTFHTSLDVTFFRSDAGHPPAAHPDQVIPVSTGSQSAAWFFLTNPSQAAGKTLSLPTNLIRARLEVYASPHSCEEFWYANPTDEFVQQHPQAGPCKGGAFREIQVFVDDVLVGVATPFPVIYTGGINPFLWRPIPSVEAFDIAPYLVDLTPFVGILTDGKSHTIAIRVANATSRWNVDGDLLLDLDHGAAVTRGAVLRNTLRPQAEVSVEQSSANGVDHLVTEAARQWTVEGWVDTSAGRVITKVRQEATVENQLDFTLTESRELEVIRQRQHTATTTTVTDGRGRERMLRVIDDYPLKATSDFSRETLANGHGSFTLRGSADVALDRKIVVADGDDEHSSRLRDQVISGALLIRDTTTGKNLAADGVESEHYVSASAGRCFNHVLRAEHGFVTQDRLLPGCGDDANPDDQR
jgi:hypothetical protein